MKRFVLILLCVLFDLSSALAGPGTVSVGINPKSLEICRQFLVRTGGIPRGIHVQSVRLNSSDWVCTSCRTQVSGVTATYPLEAAACTNCGEATIPNLDVIAPQSARPKTMEELAVEMEARVSRDFKRFPVPPPTRYRETSSEITPLTRFESLRGQAKRHLGKIIGGGVGFVVAATVFTAVTLQDTPIQGEITHARWIQTVRVEQFQPVIERAKRSEIRESKPEMPVNGMGGKPGAEIIDCEGNVCQYETYRWLEIDSKVKRGILGEEIPESADWAGLPVPQNGRVMMNTRFDVDFVFESNGEPFEGEWRPGSEKEFQAFKPGTQIMLQLDPVKSVTGIEISKEQKK